MKQSKEKQEVLEFLSDFLTYLSENGASTRKVDMVQEIQKTIMETKDNMVIKKQLERMDELADSLVQKPDQSEKVGLAARQDTYNQLERLAGYAHTECESLGKQAYEWYKPAWEKTERELRELGQVKAAYGDLMSEARLRTRIDSIKVRYVQQVKEEQKEFVSGINDVYEHMAKKIQNLFTSAKDDSIRISQKEFYQQFGKRHDTFLTGVWQAAEHTDVSGDMFERFFDGVNKRVKKIRKQANLLMVFLLVLTLAGWGVILDNKISETQDAVVQYIDETDITGAVLEELGTTGDLIQAVGGDGIMKELEEQTKDVGKTAADDIIDAIVHYLLVIACMIMICFYIVLIPLLLYIKKKFCIKKLYPAVNTEVEHILLEDAPRKNLEVAVESMIREIEAMYAQEYKGLYEKTAKPADANEANNNTLVNLTKRWKNLRHALVL